MDELIVAAPGNLAISAPKTLTDHVIAVSYVAEVPEGVVAIGLLRGLLSSEDLAFVHWKPVHGLQIGEKIFLHCWGSWQLESKTRYQRVH